MKILCVCSRGNMRSVALAYLLKDFHHQDALTAGVHSNTPSTVQMLCEWADRIVVMDATLTRDLPRGFLEKTIVCDVGPDIGFTGLRDERLLAKVRPFVKETLVPIIQENEQDGA